MFRIESRGDFKNTERFLKEMMKNNMFNNLTSLAREGVAALAAYTPKDSGTTAGSWGYEIDISSTHTTIRWVNTNLQNGFPVAIMLQYGHGTGTGGYVAGQDYINPAIRPVFDKISKKVWKEVTSA